MNGRERCFLFPTKKLKLWMEDNGYNDAVQASFYKVLLVTEDVEVQKKCKQFLIITTTRILKWELNSISN
jgi:hypothetical protein